MPSHVHVSESELPHACICCSVAGRCKEAVKKILWDRLACNIMFGKSVKEFFLPHEVFVELRRKLYEVAVYGCSGKGLVFCVCQKAMECMTKFMEECADFIWSEQRWFIGCWLGEIHHY